MRKICSSIGVSVIALAFAYPLNADVARNNLPIPVAPFTGIIRENVADSKPSPLQPVRAPAEAPNIFLFMADDVGFAMSSAFGGPVSTPNMERLAASGERYNRFHTTAICSATRAALLTGRNHHNVGMGLVSDSPTGYPGYNAHFPASAATIAQILKLNGYNTAMFGKHHDVPSGEETAAGPFDMWPTGLGFEYFYGFVGAETDQWHPNLYRDTDRVPEPDGPLTLLDRRLANDAISWVHNQNAAAPDKPFFIYYAPGSLHAPHQALPEYIARFKEKFDQGWDKVREETYRRQLAMGIIPPGTKLTPRPDEIPAWSSLNNEQKAFAARAMEVAAAMLTYQDEQLGRVLSELDRMGLLDKTLFVVIQGDNGAEGTSPRGVVSEFDIYNRLEKNDADAWRAANINKLGGPDTYPLYPAGWAWAMDTPLRWVKQYASMLGGIRNGLIMSWKGHVAHPDSICAQFGHVVDIAPTLLDAAQVPAPATVYGVAQKPMDGESLLPSLTACEPNKPRTQYFEMAGKLGLYHNGWFASRDNGRLPWQYVPPSTGDKNRWNLYDLRTDFSQSTDVSSQYPDKMKTMIALWHQEAVRNNVFPLDNSFSMGRVTPTPVYRKRFEFWGKDVSLPAMQGPLFTSQSFTLDAEFKLDRPDASGVILAIGSHFGGWSLYLDQGRPTFVYARSTNPEDITSIASSQRLPSGSTKLRLTFTSGGALKGAQVKLSNGMKVLASGLIPKLFFVPAGLGETIDVGRDLGVTVTTYHSPHGEIEGDVRHVSIDFNKSDVH